MPELAGSNPGLEKKKKDKRLACTCGSVQDNDDRYRRCTPCTVGTVVNYDATSPACGTVLDKSENNSRL